MMVDKVKDVEIRNRNSEFGEEFDKLVATVVKGIE